MATVSNENLRKVENYFVEEVKATGIKKTEATVAGIADGAGVALATAHKAIKELEQRGILTIIKPSSRRFPITYIYEGDIEGFDLAQDKDAQIEYLKDQLNKEKLERKRLMEQFNELQKKMNDGVLQNA